MSDWIFQSARLHLNIITLQFAPARGGHPLSVSLQIEQANALTIGLLGQLRAAAEQGFQLDPLTLEDGRRVDIAELPVGKSAVTESLTDPDRAVLHLATAAGLYLAYSLDRHSAGELGSALARWAEQPNT